MKEWGERGGESEGEGEREREKGKERDRLLDGKFVAL